MQSNNDHLKNEDFISTHPVTSTPIPSSSAIPQGKDKRIINNDDEEIQQDPIQEIMTTPTTSDEKIKIPSLFEIKKEAYEEKISILQENLQKQNCITTKIIPNDNLEREHLAQYFDLYKPVDLSQEALLTNTFMMSTVSSLNTIKDSLHLQIESNVELGQDWKKHIHVLDEYIKSLKSMPWKKALKYSACILTVGAFLWKMGAMRSISQFASSINKCYTDAKYRTH